LEAVYDVEESLARARWRKRPRAIGGCQARCEGFPGSCGRRRGIRQGAPFVAQLLVCARARTIQPSYKDAGAGRKSARDQNYRDAMAAAYAQYADDETTLFYGLSILGAIPEGSHGFEQQEKAARLFEAVYARHPDHPGALHYLNSCVRRPLARAAGPEGGTPNWRHRNSSRITGHPEC
jgi:hypothetical protein